MTFGFDIFNYGHSFTPVRESYSAEWDFDSWVGKPKDEIWSILSPATNVTSLRKSKTTDEMRKMVIGETHHNKTGGVIYAVWFLTDKNDTITEILGYTSFDDDYDATKKATIESQFDNDYSDSNDINGDSKNGILDTLTSPLAIGVGALALVGIGYFMFFRK